MALPYRSAAKLRRDNALNEITSNADLLAKLKTNVGFVTATDVAATTSLAANTLTHGSATLTATQIRALNATPVSILAAPGAGKTNVLVGPLILRYTQATANLAAGGAVVVQYATGSVAATGTVAAAQLQGASTDNVIMPIAAAAVQNDALQITNATGAFTGNTATGTLVVDFNYRIV